ncbi:MAG TPA: serine/threonine-protein kinase [Phycisphaerae bacterium]|nr:serine/threonine-protein kinase [Phycisphaerae bacterium]
MRSRISEAAQIFDTVIGLTDDERNEYLSERCRDNPELRAEIDSLLTAHDSAAQFLENPPVIELQQPPPGCDDSAIIGSMIGSFRVGPLIGAGGMGRVFRSEQERPRRTVALKLLSDTVATPDAVRRFQYESEILARLHHPGIAQVFEAGVHHANQDPARGIPYLALEYIQNASDILRYARDNDLTIRQRLQLFAEVCDAVHHGHQKGIIHRDLKPGNILVTPTGQPKIIDFGVARAIDADGNSTLLTRAGELVGTLQYMSPEQCGGSQEAIDIRTDVYSLGAVLYELLANERPYDVNAIPLLEAARMIQEQSPAKISNANRALRGDVEIIVHKALQKDRDMRYASAGELASDIRRHLNSQPIDAHPPSAIYQIRKFVARYTATTVLAGALLVCLIAFSIITFLQAQTIADERDRAENEAKVAAQERQRAELEALTSDRIVQFQRDMLMAAAPQNAKGNEPTVREMLGQAAKTAGEQLGDEPEVEAAIRDTLGQAYFALGEYEDAETQYDLAYALREEHLGAQHPKTLNTASNLAILYVDQSRFEDAEALYRTTLANQREALGDDHKDTITTALNYCYLLERLNRMDEAFPILEDTLQRSRIALGEDAPETLTAMNTLAVLHAKQGNYEAAEPLFRAYYEGALRVHGTDTPASLTAMHNLARIKESLGQVEAAEALMQQTLEGRIRVLGADHPDTVRCMGNLAGILRKLNRHDEAFALVADVYEKSKSKLGPDYYDTLRAEKDYANALDVRGEHVDAEPHYRSALEGFSRLIPDNHPEVHKTKAALGGCLVAQGRFEEADADLSPLLESLLQTPGQSHPLTQQVVRHLIAANQGLDNDDRVEELQDLLTGDN